MIEKINRISKRILSFVIQQKRRVRKLKNKTLCLPISVLIKDVFKYNLYSDEDAKILYFLILTGSSERVGEILEISHYRLKKRIPELLKSCKVQNVQEFLSKALAYCLGESSFLLIPSASDQLSLIKTNEELEDEII